jgi:hypothetical protein
MNVAVRRNWLRNSLEIISMKSKHIISALAASAVCSVLVVNAQTYTPPPVLFPVGVSLTPPPSGGSTADVITPANITLPQWDSTDPIQNPYGPLGVLVSVEYTLRGYMWAVYSIDQSAPSGSYTVLAEISLSFVRLANQSEVRPTLSSGFANDHLNANFPHTQGVATSFVSDPETGSLVSQSGSDMSVYEGNGSVSFDLWGTNVPYSLSGPGGDDIPSTLGRRWAAEVEITYTYELIPETSTYAAVGFLALAGGATLYRRRKANA